MSEYTYNQILEKAKKCKVTVEKEHRVGVPSAWSYYIAKAILSPKKNIKRRAKIESAPKPQGNTFKDVKIYKEDYIKCCKRLIAFVDKYNRLPNFISWNGKKIRVRTYVYNLSKILVYYDSHGKLPSYNTLNTDVWKKPAKAKKYGRSTSYGCDNRGQNNGYYCGPHMVQEIIRNLTGKVLSQSTLASVIGTTSDGSDHDGLNTAIAWFNKKYGYNLTVEWKNFSDLGWSGIKKILESNDQDCGLHELYRNTWGHYTNFDKIYDDYIDVHNSLGDYCNSGCYCGYTEERDKSEARSYLSGISQKSVLVVTNKT